MDEILECPSCSQNDGDPKILPCEHSLCVSCLRKLAKKANGKHVKCPQCFNTAEIPSGGILDFPDDFRLTQIRDYFLTYKTNRMCESNDSRHARKHCRECNMDLCAECALKHPKKTVFAGHRLLHLCVIKCKDHRKKDLEYFCPQCHIFLCNICIQRETCGDHGSKIRRISDIKEAKKAEVDEIIAKLKNIDMENGKESCEMKLTKVQELIKTVTQSEKDIKKHTEALREELSRRKERLLKQAKNTKQILLDIERLLQQKDNKKDVKRVLEAATEAIEGGIQHTIMILPQLKDKIPEEVDISKLNTNIKFKPQMSIAVGTFVGEILNIKMRFQKTNMGCTLADVVFTKDGIMAVSDPGFEFFSPKVVLLDCDGSVKADSEKAGVRLQHPTSIAYHPGEDAILVTDNQAGHVVFLDANTLHLRKTLVIQDIHVPSTIGVLSNGNLVLYKIDLWLGNKMGIFTVDGECIKFWNVFESHNVLFSSSNIMIDSHDQIWISMENAIWAFNKDGELMHKITTLPSPYLAYGLAELHDGDILVAVGEPGLPRARSTGARMKIGSSTEKRRKQTPGKVMACSQIDKSIRTIVKWDESELEALGCIISVAVNGSNMAVLGSKGVCLYTINT